MLKDSLCYHTIPHYKKGQGSRSIMRVGTPLTSSFERLVVGCHRLIERVEELVVHVFEPFQPRNICGWWLERARCVFPDAAPMLTRMKDDGRAEALLLMTCSPESPRL